jgi:two-component system sensor histidine kinase/response regulator
MMQSQGCILVIDDEVGIREACKTVLETQGYTVGMASTGQEGLERFREGTFDLVLLDVMMPDMRGIDLLDPIHEKDPEVVIIVFSGYATVQLAVEAVKAGAYDFIAKPFTPDVLLASVSQGLERRRLSLEAKRLQSVEQEAADLAREKEELERLDRFKTTFMLTVAHELRSPLTALTSFLTALLEGYIPPEERELALRQTAARAHELLDLVNDLLKLAAVKSEEALRRREVVSLAESLERVFSVLQAQADEKEVACALEIRQRPLVEADPGQMAQLWSNLISNAIRYTRPGGQVTVTLEERDGWAIGVVEDTGIGIAPKEQAEIFEEFFRASSAKEMEPHGTGLGLPLVKRVVEGHGGTIAVESEPGRGSRFTVSLPTPGEG